MNPPKCFFLKSDNTVSAELENIDIGQQDWKYSLYPEKTTLTWKFINTTNDIQYKYYLQRAFSEMLHSIALIIPRKFKFVKDNSQKTDITIEFTEDLAVFDGRKNVLGQSYFPFPNNPKNGVVQFNDNYFFTIYGESLPAHLVDPKNYTQDSGIKIKTESILHIGMHEFGHILGLHHDLVEKASIMYPYAKDGYVRKFVNNQFVYTVNPLAYTWHERDKARFIFKYGKRNLLPLWESYFLERRLRGKFVPDVPYRVI